MDEESFRVFYAATSRPLWAYVARCSGDRSLADDVVQDAYVRFLQSSLPVGATDEHRKRYLFRIATNLLTDHWRKTKRDAPMPEAIEAERSRFHESHDMSRAFEALNEKERQLLWLAYVEEEPHKEIAAMLGYKTDSVAPVLARARKKLAALLRKGGLWTTAITKL